MRADLFRPLRLAPMGLSLAQTPPLPREGDEHAHSPVPPPAPRLTSCWPAAGSSTRAPTPAPSSGPCRRARAGTESRRAGTSSRRRDTGIRLSATGRSPGSGTSCARPWKLPTTRPSSPWPPRGSSALAEINRRYNDGRPAERPQAVPEALYSSSKHSGRPLVQLKDTLRAIRPCRESETGWTPEAAMFPGNHSSLALNERGPGLKVFWLREMTRSGRRPGERGACQKRARRVMGSLPKKTEPEGAPTGLRSRVRSFWFE